MQRGRWENTTVLFEQMQPSGILVGVPMENPSADFVVQRTTMGRTLKRVEVIPGKSSWIE